MGGLKLCQLHFENQFKHYNYSCLPKCQKFSNKVPLLIFKLKILLNNCNFIFLISMAAGLTLNHTIKDIA